MSLGISIERYSNGSGLWGRFDFQLARMRHLEALSVAADKPSSFVQVKGQLELRARVHSVSTTVATLTSLLSSC